MIKKYEKVFMIILLFLFIPSVIGVLIIRNFSPPNNTISLSKLPEAKCVSGYDDFLLNINTATAEELESLPGIGHALSHKIVEYRMNNGIFYSLDELLNVPGLNRNTLNQIKPYITTGGLS